MVQFLNCFEVRPGREDAFLALWAHVNEYMQTKPGYLGHRLQRSLSPDARYRFVNLAQWESAEAWQQAHDAGFRRLVSTPEWAEFPPTPSLYETVHAAGDVSLPQH